jgi:hypothetical protein
MKENRSYDATYLLRCHKWQREAMELARRAGEAKLPPGERYTLNDFLVDAALEKARRMGIKIKDEE